MIVQFVNRQSKHPTAEWRSLLGQVLPAALTATAFGQRLAGKGTAAAVTVTFAGPRQMRKINRETRQVDSLTDVLSYPLLNLAAGRLVQPLGSRIMTGILLAGRSYRSVTLSCRWTRLSPRHRIMATPANGKWLSWRCSACCTSWVTTI